jgi:hypothetical protein
MQALDLTGQRFGRLAVLRRDGHIGIERAWLCRCDCGRTKRMRAAALRSGNSTSCGCLRLERVTTHGLHASPEYGIWKAARNRCRNPKAQGYADYGGRGIRMDATWEISFTTFYRDMGPRPSELHSIDRIDNDGGYTPDNCRWATKRQQLDNRRNTKQVTFNGATRTMEQWAALTGITASAIDDRIERGWTTEDALTLPVDRFVNRHDSPKLTLNGCTMTVPEWARRIGIRPCSLRERLSRGWSIERALTAPRARSPRST